MGAGPRSIHQLPQALLADMEQWTTLTPPMPDVVTIRTCGCQDEPWDRIILCPRHKGFFDALESGYREGYMEAVKTMDKMDAQRIEQQEPVPIDGMSQTVKVPLWVVLHAIRYGSARHTYACGDAARLAYEFWDQFPGFIQDQIVQDARRADGPCIPEWAWLWQKLDTK